MSERALIASALRAAGLSDDIRAVNPLSGGCIHNAAMIELRDGERVVAKIGGTVARTGVPNRDESRLGSPSRSACAPFDEESRGLQALYETRTVLVPRPIGVHEENGVAIFLMSYIEPGRASAQAWTQLGEDLAQLHTADAGARYGFDIDNHLGSTPQPNGWMDDWVEFSRDQRIGYQIDLAASRGLLRDAEIKELHRVIERMDELIPRRPKPALLHGDLWSGNALPTTHDRIAVIDPAVYIGDGWADIAMMKLFGGFSAGCFDAYERGNPDHDRIETRIALYQLYHILNHINIFGRGYAAQARSLAKQLMGAVV